MLGDGGLVVVTQVAIIGAGPYGLSIAAHLRSINVEYRIFGPPMDTWRNHVPSGMLLKSDGFASNLSEPSGKGTLSAFCSSRGIAYHPTDLAVPLDVFNEYAIQFQREYVPNLENHLVQSVTRSNGRFALLLDDGELVSADIVIGAIGITHFAVVPSQLAELPPSMVTHSSVHRDLSRFANRRVVVVGAGSSAVDIATLMAEAGSSVTLIARGKEIRFFSEPTPGPRTKWQKVSAPSSGLGPGWRSWACQNIPQSFRFLPSKTRSMVVKRHLGPKSAFSMKARFEAGVTAFMGEQIESARHEENQIVLTLRNSDGARRELAADHVVAATGYRPDVSRLRFLSEELRRAIRTHEGMPMVSNSFESSVPGLYFVGPPAVDSFGPLMRFMVGAEYTAPLIARHLSKKVRRPGRVAVSQP